MLKNHKGLIQKIRDSRTFKGLAVCLALNLLVELIQPTAALALTEGPSQPEVQSFEPIGTTQMVDLFTGDFNYNIPLINLPGPNGGYPINLAYHAGVSMDDEASWVGLGWNINPGALVRSMRGLPDEYISEIDSDGNWTSGDFIETKTDMKESWTIGGTFGKKTEIFGGDLYASQDGMNASIYFNNYRGIGVSIGATTSLGDESPLGIGLSLDSENGLGISPTLSLGRTKKNNEWDFDLSVSFDGNLGVQYSLKGKPEVYTESAMTPNGSRVGTYSKSKNAGSSLSYARSNFTPSIGNKINSYNLSASISFGGTNIGLYSGTSFGLYFNIQDYNNEDKIGRKRGVVGYAEFSKFLNSEYATMDFTRVNDGQITKDSPLLPQSHYTYDIYNSTGQGLSGYFRGRRNDVGRVHDPKLKNTTWGASLDLEIKKIVETGTAVVLEIPEAIEGVPQPPIPTTVTVTNPLSNHLGAGGSISSGWNSQGSWDNKNELNFDFGAPRPGGIKENHFYQFHGEQTILDNNEYSHIGGTDLALIKFKEWDVLSGGKREVVSSENSFLQNNRIVSDEDRVVRNSLVHSLKNNEVDHLGEFQINYYQFDANLGFDFVVAADAPTTPLDRDNRLMNGYNNRSIEKHPAGFKVLNEEGSYYVYSLPAYNTKEVQNLFSVETPQNPESKDAVQIVANTSGDEVDYKVQGTHKFISKTTKSPYAHSYMLTSVQGADYVDVDNNGPSDNDLGYWVKFDYVQYSDNVKWKAPFEEANYYRGNSYTVNDDKGSYSYGEKEQWYVGRIETKTHIAVFEMSERKDMMEAKGEFENFGYGTQSGLKLNKIKVYEKNSFLTAQDPNDVIPLQVIHFEYDYSLCQNTPNNNNSQILDNETANQGGKLTLKKVWFTSNNSRRGELTPYEFDYTSVNLDPIYNNLIDLNDPNNLLNPQYRKNAYDPWGTYHPFSGTVEQYSHFPYTAQHGQGWQQNWMSNYVGDQETTENKKLTKIANDLKSSVWSLRKIKLPSGGEINIDYESDDYSHVQHKVANQMFKILKFGDYTEASQLYQGGNSDDFYNTGSVNDEYRRRIYFKLENPIKVEAGAAYSDTVYNQYVKPIIQDEKGDRNLYFKSRMKLTHNANNEVYDYVSGYLPLENGLSKVEGGQTYYNYGISTADLDVDGVTVPHSFISGTDTYYTIGYVTIQPTKKRSENDFYQDYHPMALAAWTYMQTNAQELLNPSSGFNSSGSTPQSVGDVLNFFTNILNAVPAAASSFGLIRKYCKTKDFAKFVDLENSGIRLASPDQLKYGGGHRVKQITISDNWDADTDNTESNRTYGQVFDYTTTNEEGRVISSGVAQYEPQAGGDENALKYPFHYNASTGVFTNNNLIAEGPINESLFPGASVGYRKVTVQSLNTQKQLKLAQTSNASGRTGGITVHEFYTSKEFPTIVEHSVLSENNRTKDVFNLPIPIPFIGSIKRNYYHGSQAFKIELNDMHGRLKSVKSFEINDYEVNNSPITESIFEYQSKPISYQGELVNILENDVTVMPNDGSHDIDAITNKRSMGMEVELFTDQRENKTFNSTIGLDFNVDIIPFAGIGTFWPSYSNHKTMFRTYVTNKVIHRSGILKRTKSRDLQTINESEIVAYDEKSGSPMLTKVKNEFGDSFYNYNIPAYYHYDRMGHAYRNINYSFMLTLDNGLNVNPESRHIIVDLPVNTVNNITDYLVRGDELIITAVGGSASSANLYKKAYFLGWTYSGNDVYAKIDILNPVNSSGGALGFKVIRSGRRNHYNTNAGSYLTKGLLTEIGSEQIGPVNETVSTPIIDNVLSASANLFKDDWFTVGNTDLNFDGTIENPFIQGNSGNWRPFKSYSYVGPRNRSASMESNIDDAPSLSNDGVMNNVKMFSWEIGNIEEYVSNWEWVNEITKFSSDAYELENVDRLGIYSSALYGYNNSLSIAIGGNATVHEIGAYDFELSSVSNFEMLVSQTNMNFDDAHTSGNLLMSEQANITSATMNASNSMEIVTDILASSFNVSNYESNVGLALVSRSGVATITNEGFYLNGNQTGISTNAEGYVVFTVTPFLSANETYDMLIPGSKYYGKISLLKSRGVIQSQGAQNIEFTALKSHTGKKCMKVAGVAQFDQPQLKLINGKKYIWSMWVSKDNTNTTDFNPENYISLGTSDGVSFDFLSNDITYSMKTGKIIEGWQKVDIEISANVSDVILAIEINTGLDHLYVDDIRFSPKTGGITTYVYDPNKFWLRATLNADNYATLYFYDEQGNLTLKKIETEEGIFTITESRGHVSEY